MVQVVVDRRGGDEADNLLHVQFGGEESEQRAMKDSSV
jgi:hypothetical protein